MRGEGTIDQRDDPGVGIDYVYLDPQVFINPNAQTAIREADLIVLGPGDLYTSIVPNLLVKGIPEALHQTSATLIYVCNLMTKRGEPKWSETIR